MMVLKTWSVKKDFRLTLVNTVWKVQSILLNVMFIFYTLLSLMFHYDSIQLYIK